MKTLRRRRLALVSLVTLLGVAMPAAAFAHNFGSQGTAGTGGTTSGVWFTPNSYWAAAGVNLNEFEFSMVVTMEDDYSPTDLDLHFSAPTSCTGSSGYDLCMFDSNYGDNDLYGWNACAGFTAGSHPNQTCTMDWVRWNTFFSTTIQEKNSIACHEIGHSVGLRHPTTGTDTTSCMRNDIDPGINQSLNQSMINHLNDKY